MTLGTNAGSEKMATGKDGYVFGRFRRFSDARRTLGRSDVRTLGRPDARASGRPDARTPGRSDAYLPLFLNFCGRCGEGPSRAAPRSVSSRAAPSRAGPRRLEPGGAGPSPGQLKFKFLSPMFRIMFEKDFDKEFTFRRHFLINVWVYCC